MTKELGKIDYATFGIGGYQDCMLGISLGFALSDGGGVSHWIGFWDCNKIKCSSSCKWTEEDRDKRNAETMRKVSDLLHQCKVWDVKDLVGKPVEVTMDGNMFHDFRILTEVL